VDGQTVFEYTGESGYSRIHTVELPAGAFADGRGTLIELHSSELDASRDRLKMAIGRQGVSVTIFFWQTTCIFSFSAYAA
jgi:hypothetical protein